jgi:hypothetical protein
MAGILRKRLDVAMFIISVLIITVGFGLAFRLNSPWCLIVVPGIVIHAIAIYRIGTWLLYRGYY